MVAEEGKPVRKRRTRRRKTSHLKQVPKTKALREELRQQCRDLVMGLDPTTPLAKDEMESICRQMLTNLGQPEGYLGWTMVILSSEFWREQVAAVPPSRRLFLLPHCLKHAEGCPADYDQFGLDCKTCGACSIADFRTTADEMGYKVLVAEGSPIVLKIIVSGYVDAIVGVACLNVLEKAIDKILLAGIPCMAVPLLSDDCRNTSVDEDWVEQMVDTPYKETKRQTRSYIHLLRSSSQIFEPDNLERLVPRVRGEVRLSEVDNDGRNLDPISATEAISVDFLSRGGKHSRPFITLAAYDALKGNEATLKPQVLNDYPDAIFRTAMSIETFHKASLVHDDIEDDDQFRYGQQALHLKYGIPTAINIGDYLIGLGYRLVSRDAAELGPDVAADILDYLANAHLRLSEGQGAELLWRDRTDKGLKPIDALRIYALKTSPAFEAALYAGVRLAMPLGEYQKPLRDFARNLGVAFQILNDLKDWEGDDDNKLAAGGDLLSGRPTLLWALALENLPEKEQMELQDLVENASDQHARHRLVRARQLYLQAGVFEKANALVDRYQEKAEVIADDIDPESLRRLLYYLVDTVLSRTETDYTPTIEFAEPSMKDALPIVTG